mmetsp:Transcript_17706/g.31246  ORF Transcript_17706/g.31246 Transcript_17706/m.31246 type:complete len:401 (+) Transcript_17706:1895-3097(+)
MVLISNSRLFQQVRESQIKGISMARQVGLAFLVKSTQMQWAPGRQVHLERLVRLLLKCSQMVKRSQTSKSTPRAFRAILEHRPILCKTKARLETQCQGQSRCRDKALGRRCKILVRGLQPAQRGQEDRVRHPDRDRVHLRGEVRQDLRRPRVPLRTMRPHEQAQVGLPAQAPPSPREHQVQVKRNGKAGPRQVKVRIVASSTVKVKDQIRQQLRTKLCLSNSALTVGRRRVEHNLQFREQALALHQVGPVETLIPLARDLSKRTHSIKDNDRDQDKDKDRVNKCKYETTRRCAEIHSIWEWTTSILQIYRGAEIQVTCLTNVMIQPRIQASRNLSRINIKTTHQATEVSMALRWSLCLSTRWIAAFRGMAHPLCHSPVQGPLPLQVSPMPITNQFRGILM